MKTINNNITELKENQIFVFGSNLSGMHGGGAALTALNWGAKMGQGVGLQGRTYAIPTKSYHAINTLQLATIKEYVDIFIAFAKYHPELEFLVTEIGCGLAGLKVSEVAPLFKDALDQENIILPNRFFEYLNL